MISLVLCTFSCWESLVMEDLHKVINLVNNCRTKKSKLDTGEMIIMHMVVWMNTAGATG